VRDGHAAALRVLRSGAAGATLAKWVQVSQALAAEGGGA
jgi:hypothetical protein